MKHYAVAREGIHGLAHYYSRLDYRPAFVEVRVS